MNIAKNIENIKSQLPDNVRLIAVSKYHSTEEIITAYNAGQRDFGENKIQELLQKQEELQNLDICWHLIGHLQTNKVKYIANFVEYIHSVDNLKLLQEINNQAIKQNRKIKCLLEFHIAEEETKFGLNLEKTIEILDSEEYKLMQNIEICGIMGMASFTDDLKKIYIEFNKLKKIFDFLKEKYYFHSFNFHEISMGMSNDWKIAIEAGSTMIRIGTQIFGERNY
ncbi:MAG: YggS family pyridoxal phosphate-dependent enzyme [Bacteroidales bacterium]|jgi:pyridoxal phosphate enzyme (YggS family)|nr:YggS family pyridoxal phosphate-dependent enzyme [Bacteroidales bacterium]